MRIEGKVVLITGASRGIGAACAAEFRARGARLSLTARSEEALAAAGGADALVTPGDITDAAVRRRAVARTVERYGRLDVLINNAGCGLYRPTWDAPLPEAERLFALNFFAPLEMMQLVLPHMRRARSGSIVNVSSIGGRVPLPWLNIYSASKSALGALTDGLRMELKGSGVHLMTVCPGYVRTGFQDRAMGGRPPAAVAARKARAITAARCAHAIARGVERGARTVVTPWTGWLLIAAQRLLPALVEGRLAAMNGKLWTPD